MDRVIIPAIAWSIWSPYMGCDCLVPSSRPPALIWRCPMIGGPCWCWFPPSTSPRQHWSSSAFRCQQGQPWMRFSVENVKRDEEGRRFTRWNLERVMFWLTALGPGLDSIVRVKMACDRLLTYLRWTYIFLAHSRPDSFREPFYLVHCCRCCDSSFAWLLQQCHCCFDTGNL